MIEGQRGAIKRVALAKLGAGIALYSVLQFLGIIFMGFGGEVFCYLPPGGG
jgi:hypothetical protein